MFAASSREAFLPLVWPHEPNFSTRISLFNISLVILRWKPTEKQHFPLPNLSSTYQTFLIILLLGKIFKDVQIRLGIYIINKMHLEAFSHCPHNIAFLEHPTIKGLKNLNRHRLPFSPRYPPLSRPATCQKGTKKCDYYSNEVYQRTIKK